jgi:predicted regulator of Ras-like GTPase activity (Roadblock/LC7/MglB family)
MAQQDHWGLVDEDLAPFRVLLHRLLRKSSARTAILTDTSGHHLTLAGKRPEFDLTTFLAVCAGDYAASREMATMLGEDRFQALYHESERSQIYITEIAPASLLVLLFHRESTLGLVRWAVKKYRDDLRLALDAALMTARARAGTDTGTEQQGPTAQSVDDALDAFFDA